MKKAFVLFLTLPLVLTMQLSCNKLPSSSPDNPPPSESPEQQEPPDSAVEIWGHLSNDEYDSINKHAIGGGEFIFKEKKYEFQGNNLVIADVKNETDNNYTLVVHCSYFDEAGEPVFTESRTYEGWAAGYTQPILFLPMMAFDSYEYRIEVQPYDGVCFGEKHQLKYMDLWVGKTNIGYDLYPTLLGGMWETNYNTAPFFRNATCVLFDNTGNVHGIYIFPGQYVDIQVVDMAHRSVMIVYQYMGEEMVWPEQLKGNLSCVIVPYYATDNVSLFWISDIPKLKPDTPPPRPYF